MLFTSGLIKPVALTLPINWETVNVINHSVARKVVGDIDLMIGMLLIVVQKKIPEGAVNYSESDGNIRESLFEFESVRVGHRFYPGPRPISNTGSCRET